jgi:hypothetical protein
MARRSADLMKYPTRKPEQIRLYGRYADEILGDLATEFECRRKELLKRCYALLKEAQKQGIDQDGDKYLRAMRGTVGLVTAAVCVRLARAGVRGLYPAFEKHCGQAVDGLRDKKYGKGKGRQKGPDDEKMDI